MTPTGITKIGVVQPMNLGDMLCAVPLFRALRHAWPAAEMVMVGDSLNIPFYQCFRHYFDRLIVRDEELSWTPVEQLTDYVNSMRREQFDLVVKLYFWVGTKPETSWWEDSFAVGNDVASESPLLPEREMNNHDYWKAHERSIQLTCSLGGRYTVGIADPAARRPPGFIGVPFHDNRHVTDNLLGVAEALNIPTLGRDLEFPLPQRATRAATKLLIGSGIPENQVLMGITPGASVRFRRWPEASFAKMADRLVADYGARVVITGTDRERPLARRVIEQMRHGDRAHDVTGKTTLQTLAALVDRMRLLVTNNTGTMHLAVARRRPSIGIFGFGLEATRWASHDSALHRALLAPGGGKGAKHAEAVRSVSVAQALEAVNQLLDRPWPKT